MTRVSVVGATGYAGAELTALIARHPALELAGCFSSAGGARLPLEAVHSSLAGRTGPAVEPCSLDALLASRPDCVLLATPHEASADLAPALLAQGVRVIDLSGAFRLRQAGDYPRWYGFAHPAPELLEDAVYGLTEWTNGELAGARLVANPGCYPTSVLLPLKPLQRRLAPGHPIVCDAKSGVSGAGKRAELGYSFAELAGNFKPYGVGTHRHEPEMRQQLGLDPDAPFVFVPHLLPLVRGMLTTLHLSLAAATDAHELLADVEAAYAESPLVRVLPAGRLPELRSVVGTPFAEIGASVLPGGRQAVVVCAIDNLLKGAASQAVQNLNRMLGMPEDEGLR